jgi:hypothetical protein
MTTCADLEELAKQYGRPLQRRGTSRLTLAINYE